MDPLVILAAFCIMATGATIKGLLGIGLPMVAIPGLTLLYGLPQALATIAIPVAAANAWQVVQFRRAERPAGVLLPFMIAGGAGTVVGTMILASVAEIWLETTLAFMLLGYVILRLRRPNLVIRPDQARRMAMPTGLIAGLVQGATGISGPIAITFLHAQRLARESFILSTGAAFLAFILFQIPVLGMTGIMGTSAVATGLLGLPAVAIGLWSGNRLARYVDAVLFDRLLLTVLVGTSAALFWRAWSG